VRFSSLVSGLLPVAHFLLLACGAPEPDPVVPDTTATAPATASADPTAVPSVEATASTAATASPAASAAAAVPAPPLPQGLKVLIIGDSFAEALGAGLRTRESSTGLKFFLRGEKATFIPEWAGPKRGVAGMMVSLKPDVVVIALGGNELAMTTPDIRGPKVKELVGLIGSTPCVWVSPPLWGGGKDNGLLGVIHDNSKPCRYYDSTLLAPDVPRGSDKIHPTADGQKKWADYFLGWLQKEQEKAAPFSLKPRPAAE